MLRPGLCGDRLEAAVHQSLPLPSGRGEPMYHEAIAISDALRHVAGAFVLSRQDWLSPWEVFRARPALLQSPGSQWP